MISILEASCVHSMEENCQSIGTYLYQKHIYHIWFDIIELLSNSMFDISIIIIFQQETGIERAVDTLSRYPSLSLSRLTSGDIMSCNSVNDN